MDVASIRLRNYYVLFPQKILSNKFRETICIATLHMLFVKMLVREMKVKIFFCDKMGITHKDTWHSGGNTPCTFKLTSRWR